MDIPTLENLGLLRLFDHNHHSGYPRLSIVKPVIFKIFYRALLQHSLVSKCSSC